jgi:ABC-type Na+ transport system ATPase subunit NatA
MLFLTRTLIISLVSFISLYNSGWSWFLTFFLFHCITATLTALVSTKLYVASAAWLLWIYWILTFCAIVTFCMTLAALTSKSTRAVLLGLLVFLGGVFLAIFAFDYQTASVQIVSLISLHPVAAFCFGLQEIGNLEDQGVGLQLASIGTSDTAGGYTFMNCIFSLIIDCFLWGFMSWYLNRVITPDYGQALPFYYPLLLSYWFPNMSRKRKGGRSSDVDNDDNDCGDDDESVELVQDEDVPFEPVSDALMRQAKQGKSIEIRNLRKSFGDKIAVDGLSLSMYAGQVTALLGHNGAGKTTTIGMLTGAISATSGCAKVAGKNVQTQISEVRQDLGICLQHDCLFPMLTVREHVAFFAQIKGLYARNEDGKSRAEKQAEVDQAILDVALGEKRNTLAKNLSGGMKRKLSVAIAFCGGSKVVLLDEPTSGTFYYCYYVSHDFISKLPSGLSCLLWFRSLFVCYPLSGMDPFSRRFTWNVIRQYRKDRCIILT